MTAPEKMWRSEIGKCPMYPDGGAFYHETAPKEHAVEYTRADLLTAAQAEIARLTAALEYYADRNEEGYEIWITDYGGWTGYSMENGPIIEDAGAIARAALDGQHKDTTK